jgi:hypothetical protein
LRRMSMANSPALRAVSLNPARNGALRLDIAQLTASRRFVAPACNQEA